MKLHRTPAALALTLAALLGSPGPMPCTCSTRA